MQNDRSKSLVMRLEKFVKDRDSSMIAILLAGYRMILTSKTIEALSH